MSVPENVVPMLQLKAIYGLNTDLRNHIRVVGDRIYYLAGYNVVSFNYRERSLQFYSGLQGYSGFSAIQISTLKKQIAMALICQAKPAIVCQDLGHSTSKRRKLQFPELNVREWVSLVYSPNPESKCLIALSSNEPLLACISTQKSKGILGSYKIACDSPLFQVKCASFSQAGGNEYYSVLGHKIFKTFKLTASSQKTYSFTQMASSISSMGEPAQNFMAHTWINPSSIDICVVCCTKSAIYIVDQKGNEIDNKTKADIPPWKEKEDPFFVLAPWNSGFIVGGPHGLAYFIYQYGEYKFVKHKDMRVKEIEHGIKGLDVADQRVYVTTSQSTIMCSKNLEMDKFQQIGLANHTGPIISMDICVKKPLIATACRQDRCIKIWNFQDKTVETIRNQTESINCLTFHPSGLHLVVAFSDKIKLMNVNKDGQSLHNYKQISQFRNCTQIRFAHGGHLFAAASQSTIYLYKFYQPDAPLKVFKDHNTARVKSLSWSKEDNILVSCANDGTIFGFKISLQNEGRVLNYIPPKEEKAKSGITYCAVLTHDLTVHAPYFCSFTGEKVCKEIGFNGVQKGRRQLCKATVTQVAFTSTSRILVAGTEQGYIKAFKMPLNQQQMFFPAHDSRGIQKLRITYDDKYVISAGKDGCLMVFQIKDKEGSAERTKEGFGYSNEIFVQKKDLQNLKNDEQEKVEIDNTLMSAGRDQNNKLTDQLNRISQERARQYQGLLEKKRMVEAANKQELKSKKDQNDNSLQLFDNNQGKKVVQENAAFDKLKRMLQVEANNKERDYKNELQKYTKKINQTRQEYQRKLSEEKGKLEDLQRRIEHNRRKHEETMKEIEEEQEEEIKKLNSEANKKEHEFTESAFKFKSDMSITKKKILTNKAEFQKYKDEQDRDQLQAAKLKEQKDELNKQIENMNLIIVAKDQQIAKNEKTIYQYKKTSQELQKFKYVLDHKIKELKRDIGPRQDKLNELKQCTNKMDQELKAHNATNSKLAEAVSQLYKHQQTMKVDINKQRARIAQKNVKIKQFKDGLYQAVQYIQNQEELKKQAKSLHQKFVKQAAQITRIDEEIEQEYKNQRKFLMRSVSMLKRNLQRQAQNHKSYYIKIMRQNVKLINDNTSKRKEIKDKSKNTKRQENTQLKAEVQELQNTLANLQRKHEQYIKKIIAFQNNEMQIN